VLTLVRSKTQHLRQIVEALLFLARADAEALKPRLETLDLAEWIETHTRHWPESVRAADVRLVVGSARPLTARVQPALLADLVNNLVENASRYSSPGTPIRVTLQAGSDSVDLTVGDEGIGIAPSDLPHIFEPFYRSAEARRHGSSGLGLGLSIARRLAISFGGTIEAESRPYQGTRFLLRLPRIDQDRHAEREPAHSGPVFSAVSGTES
jgi:signal transduction histidine kinase